MPSNFKLITKTVLTGNQSSVTFNSLGSYTHMYIVVSLRTISGSDWTKISVNGGAGSFSTRMAYGDTSGTGNELQSANPSFLTTVVDPVAESGLYNTGEIWICNYSGATMPKNLFSWSAWGAPANTRSRPSIINAVNSTTGAISSLTFTDQSNSGFATDSSFYLYGLNLPV